MNDNLDADANLSLQPASQENLDLLSADNLAEDSTAALEPANSREESAAWESLDPQEQTSLVPIPPEDYGLPFTYQSLTAEKARVWDNQEMFLAAYRQHGKLGLAAKAAGLTRYAQDKWLILDQLGWRERVKSAHQDWCETKIEGKIQERLDNPTGNRGSDILLMFQAKAEMPEKYREEVKIINTQATKDLLDELRSKGKPRVVEGTVSPEPPGQPSE